jgi:CheY-like chemotaxis protein
MLCESSMSLLAVLQSARSEIVRAVVDELLTRDEDASPCAQSTIIDDLPRLLSELETALVKSDFEATPSRPRRLPHFAHGFQLPQVIREYGVVRRAIFHQLAKRGSGSLTVRELDVLAELLDSRIRAAVDQYVAGHRPAVDSVTFDGPLPVSHDGDDQPLAGVSVMIVDDDPDALELGSMVLRRAGAKVQEAGGAQLALLLLEQGPVQVLVSDIGMPDVDGYELMQRLRMRAGSAAIRAVAVTAFVRQEDRERALRAGFDDHLAKPTAPEVLVDTVARLAAMA